MVIYGKSALAWTALGASLWRYKTDVLLFPLDLTGPAVRNPVPTADLLYDARVTEHNPTLRPKTKKARSTGSGLARRTELIQLGRVKVLFAETHGEMCLLTVAVKL